MRDPESVGKAQRAASALERAWQRWRATHGLAAGSLPAISSYVGYSFEEPYGQPRVVFGLSATDAEHLAALLDRHDCVGPVHAMFAAYPVGRDAAVGTGGHAGQSLPVPQQAPPALAEFSPAPGRPAGAAAQPDESGADAPVFRQVAAAARQAAAARAQAAAGLAPGDAAAEDDAGEDGAAEGDAGEARAAEGGAGARDAAAGTGRADDAGATAGARVGGVGAGGAAGGKTPGRRSSGRRSSAGRSAEGKAAGGRPAEGKAAGGRPSEARPSEARPSDGHAQECRGGGAEGRPEAQGAAARKLAAALDTSSSSEQPAGSAVADAVPALAGSAPAVGAVPVPTESGEAAPGPLALAACAARIEAEARIRAALRESRLAAGLEYPYGGSFDVTEPTGPLGQVPAAGAPGCLPGQEPRVRPQAAAGAYSRPAGVASERGGPERGADSGQPAVVPFRPRPELAAYLDAGPEPDATFGVRPDSSEVGQARRNRVTRGYSIPRLSRTKRPGAVPGA